MRKADYAALAAIIKEKADKAFLKESEYSEGEYFTARAIAHEFAKIAHVDKAEFLKACGIE